MSKRAIIVDDSDLNIQYVGGRWFQDLASPDQVGNLGPTYQHTLQGTRSSGSFSFKFEGPSFPLTIVDFVTHPRTGSAVKVFGAAGRRNPASGDLTWRCSIDDITIPLFDPPNNGALCEERNLADGPHVITVDVTQSTGNRTFWFDYLRYIPSPNVSQDFAYVVVPNADPAIKYGTGWTPLIDLGNRTSTAGAELTFDFIGMYHNTPHLRDPYRYRDSWYVINRQGDQLGVIRSP